MSKAVENLKNLYKSQTVEKKTFSLKDAFTVGNKAAKKYVQDDGSLLFPVIGLASKFVPKYCNANNAGYHTMMYLDGGINTGGFSTALYNFSQTLYQAAKVPYNEYVSVTWDKPILVRVTIEAFDKEVEKEGKTVMEPRTTYHFEIVSGEAENFKWMTSVEQYGTLIASASALELPEVVTDVGEPE